MSMFPKITTAEYLQTVPAKFGDVKSAVAKLDGRYFKGQKWKFWMEDDPRRENGIEPLATYACIESGELDSQWECIE